MTNSITKRKTATAVTPTVLAMYRGYLDAAMDFPFDYEYADKQTPVGASNYELGRLIVTQLTTWGKPLPPMAKLNVKSLNAALNAVTQHNKHEPSPFADGMFKKGTR